MIVETLKQSIIQNAVLGKLFTQCSTDTDIKKYLEEVIQETKKSKEIINEFSTDVELNANWNLIKLGNICEVYGGKRIPAGRKLTTEDTGYPYIRVADMNNITVELDNILYVPSDIYPSIQKYIISKDDLYITVAGTIGKIGFVPDKLDGANLTENANKLVFSKLNQKWLYYVLISPFVQNQIKEFTTKVGQPKLAIKRIVNLEIPVPPPEEQNRIVSKIDEVLTILEDIRPIENKLIELKNQFPNEMRMSLMNDAMSGKLTHQIENESVDKIVKELNITNKVTDVLDGPFAIPSNWIWMKFGELVKFNIGKTPPRSNLEYWNGSYHWVSISDMPENDYIFDTKECISDLAFENIFKKKISKKGTLLMSFKLTVGRCSILDIDAFHNEGIISIYPNINSETLKMYLFKILPYITKYGNTKGAIKGNTLNSKSLNDLLIPIPPLEEQKRIIDKLDKLLPICNELQTFIN